MFILPPMRLDRSAADRPVDLQSSYRSIFPIVMITGHGDLDRFFPSPGLCKRPLLAVFRKIFSCV